MKRPVDKQKRLDYSLVEQAEASGDNARLVTALTKLSNLAFRAADFALSESLAGRAEKLITEDPSIVKTLRDADIQELYHLLFLGAEARGDLDRARQSALQALIRLAERNPTVDYLPQLRNLAHIELQMGNLEAASQFCIRFRPLQDNDPETEATYLSILGRILATEEAWDNAVAVSSRAVEASRPIGKSNLAYALRTQIMVCAGSKLIDATVDAASELRQIQSDSWKPRANDHLAFGYTALAIDDLDGAMHHCELAYEVMTPGYDFRDGGAAGLLYGLILLANGELEAANEAALTLTETNHVSEYVIRRSLRLLLAVQEQLGDKKGMVDTLWKIEARIGEHTSHASSAEDDALQQRLIAIVSDNHSALLEELLWQKSEVQQIVLHDLNGALAACQVAVDVLSKRDSTLARKTLVHGTETVKSVVEVLSVLSSLDQQRFRAQHEWCELDQVIAQVLAPLDSVAAAREIRITDMSARLGPSAVLLDRRLLAMILTNLVSNAIKYSTAGGTVTVDVQPTSSPHGVRVSVTDNGPGLDPGEVDLIFERHRRGTAAARGEPGLGLGLYIARALAELMGSTLTAASAGIGTGSSFDLTIPSPHVVDGKPASATAV